MRPHLLKIVAAVLALALLTGCANRHDSEITPPNAERDEELGRIRTAVERALTAPPPRGYEAIPRGTRLLSLSRGADRVVVMNFSEALTAGGRGKVLEDALHQIFTAASEVRRDTPNRVDDYRVLIRGVPLDADLR